ncbi:flavodoxin [Pseudarthrobacter sp. PvP090]|uniref:flavodoxin n=1 Tax=Pseudarthrobacter sp. PvP090 TaxID=3156393 RepID=UPI003398C8EF
MSVTRRSALRGAAAGLTGALLAAGTAGRTLRGTETMPPPDQASSPGTAGPGQSGRRIPISNPLPAMDQYDTVILASGIWNVRAPMIMTTFTESYDFTGKIVYPITTHAMSGLGTTARDYRQSCRGQRSGKASR